MNNSSLIYTISANEPNNFEASLKHLKVIHDRLSQKAYIVIVITKMDTVHNTFDFDGFVNLLLGYDRFVNFEKILIDDIGNVHRDITHVKDKLCKWIDFILYEQFPDIRQSVR